MMERDGIERVLRNIHESLKWTWQLIMGFALVCAVGEYFKIIEPSITFNKISATAGPGQFGHWLFLLFVLSFIRFLFGNNRYLDERYIEFIFKIHEIEEPKRDDYIMERTHKLSGKRRFYDIIMLIMTGVVFVILGKSLGTDKQAFVTCYIVLLIANVFFLSVSVVWNIFIEVGHKQTQKKIIRIILSIYEYERFPIIWIVNNSACLILFLLNLHFQVVDKYVAFVSVFYLNSIVDLWLTWKLYFPPISISKAVDTQ